MCANKDAGGSRKEYIYILFFVICIVAVVIRLHGLDYDPPMYFDGHSQSLATDPNQYSYFARNKIVFDHWEMFDSARWRVFEATLISGLSYISFHFLGISRNTANLPAVLVSIAAMLVFLAALRRAVKAWPLLLVLAMISFNKTFFVYGRLPYTENGMILMMAVIFYIFVYGRWSLWGQIALGILAALAALAGKLIGGLIIIPLVLSFLYEDRRRGLGAVLIVSAAALSVGTAWIVLFYGGELRLLLEFYQAQILGLHGFPAALKSPFAFFEKLISFGGDSRFYFHAPVLGIAAFLAIIAIFSGDYQARFKRNVPLLFLVIWFAIGWFAFMPENYRPVRYIYMLYLPLAGIIGYFFSMPSEEKHRADGRNKAVRFLLFFLIWVFLYQAISNLFFINEFEHMHRRLTWFTILPALAIVYFDSKHNFLKFVARLGKTKAVIPIAFVLLALNFGLSFAPWEKQKSSNLREAGKDLGEILGRGAVICGPIASSLILENKLGGIIYAVGITDKDPDFFLKYPVTHFVVDADASGLIIEKFPDLAAAATVSEYWICDVKVIAVRINNLTGNVTASSYRPTDYEVGRELMNRQSYDSALIYMERFIDRYPDNKSCLRALGELYPINGRTEEGLSALQKAANSYPNDFSILLALAAYYQKRFMASGEERFMHLARQTYLRVLDMNPYQADEVSALIKRIEQHK
jgi:hypothetical protein